MNLNLLRRELLFIVSALYLTIVIFQSVHFSGYSRANFDAMIAGSAYRPFVYRALYPTIIRTTSPLLSEGVKQDMREFALKNDEIRFIIRNNKLSDQLIPEIFLYVGLSFISFYGFLRVLRELIVHFYPHFSSLEADIYTAGVVLPLILSLGHYFYIYDVGIWFTFGLATLFMVQHRWLPFLVAFIICTLNKESSLLLLSLLYLQTRKHESLKLRVVLLTSTLLMWLITFGLIRYNYRINPGEMLEFHLFDQWTSELQPKVQVSFFRCMPIWLIFVSLGWKQKDTFLKQSLIYTFTPLALLMLFFGFVCEIRDYYESLIFAYLLSIPPLYQFFSRFKLHSKRNLVLPTS